MPKKLNTKTGQSKTGEKKAIQKPKVRKINPLKPKGAQVCDKYLDVKADRMKPITFAWLDRFAQRLIDWATADEQAFHIGSFYTKEEISKKDFYRLAAKHQVLKDALAKALDAIDTRVASKSE